MMSPQAVFSKLRNPQISKKMIFALVYTEYILYKQYNP
jgi:hypothetical protein